MPAVTWSSAPASIFARCSWTGAGAGRSPTTGSERSPSGSNPAHLVPSFALSSWSPPRRRWAAAPRPRDPRVWRLVRRGLPGLAAATRCSFLSRSPASSCGACSQEKVGSSGRCHARHERLACGGAALCGVRLVPIRAHLLAARRSSRVAVPQRGDRCRLCTASRRGHVAGVLLAKPNVPFASLVVFFVRYMLPVLPWGCCANRAGGLSRWSRRGPRQRSHPASGYNAQARCRRRAARGSAAHPPSFLHSATFTPSCFIFSPARGRRIQSARRSRGDLTARSPAGTRLPAQSSKRAAARSHQLRTLALYQEFTRTRRQVTAEACSNDTG
jgi:hypothetical protein